ncbi:MAG: ArsR/SmtB family transcription factor [Candidatus Hodarchaeota archaeon]
MKQKRKSEIKEMLCSCEECVDSSQLFENLQNFGNNLKINDNFNARLSLLNALGNKERLSILYALKEKARCVCELEVILDKSQPSISHHLRELEKANLIRGWKRGKFTYYSLLKNELKKNLELIYKEFSL